MGARRGRRRRGQAGRVERLYGRAEFCLDASRVVCVRVLGPRVSTTADAAERRASVETLGPQQGVKELCGNGTREAFEVGKTRYVHDRPRVRRQRAWRLCPRRARRSRRAQTHFQRSGGEGGPHEAHARCNMHAVRVPSRSAIGSARGQCGAKEQRSVLCGSDARSVLTGEAAVVRGELPSEVSHLCAKLVVIGEARRPGEHL